MTIDILTISKKFRIANYIEKHTSWLDLAVGEEHPEPLVCLLRIKFWNTLLHLGKDLNNIFGFIFEKYLKKTENKFFKNWIDTWNNCLTNEYLNTQTTNLILENNEKMWFNAGHLFKLISYLCICAVLYTWDFFRNSGTEITNFLFMLTCMAACCEQKRLQVTLNNVPLPGGAFFHVP